MIPEPRPEILQMTPYTPGKPIAEVQRELGLTEVIKLASNENPLGPSPKAIEAAARALQEAHIYPEATAPQLREALARRFGLTPDWVLVSNGSDEVFRLLAETYVRPGDKVVIPKESFAIYTSVAKLMGAQVELVPLTPSGTMDLPAMAAAARGETGAKAHARLVFLASPHNPTGGTIGAQDFRNFMEQVPPDTLVVLDEAYKEFDPSDFQGPGQLSSYDNLVVSRTFSKAYGLAGIRLGYGLANPGIWQPVLTARDPFSVNLVAQAAGLAALEDKEFLERSVTLAAEGRQFFKELAGELGLVIYESAANFVLLDLKRDSMPVYTALLHQGVIVRPTASFGLPTCIRVTCGLPWQNERFAQALRQVLDGA